MRNDEYLVRPAGELDIATVPHLRDEWIRVVEQTQPALFVIDLDAVTYLDSTALGAIVAIKNRQHEHGGGVIVTHARPRLARLFQLTGLDSVIEVVVGAQPTHANGRPSTRYQGSEIVNE